MMRLLAIDPGNRDSAYVIVDADTCRPLEIGKVDNRELRRLIATWVIDAASIEMIASYGMAVGADVFETCVWIGVFAETIRRTSRIEASLVKRNPIKMHLCHTSKANDANIRQALVDRFAQGASNHGKGTKDSPGWFHGFSADVWAAYALAVYAADHLHPRPAEPTGAPY